MRKSMKILLIVGVASIIVGVICISVYLTIVGGNPIDGTKLINGFSSDESDPVMLVDYCSKRVGTVGGDGYSETVLYQRKDGSCEVHYYSRYDGDEFESHKAYSVDKSVIREAYEVINLNGIAQWNSKSYMGAMGGGYYVLKFRNSKGEYVRVSSDCMPEDGVQIMSAVCTCMDAAARSGHQIIK